MNKLFGIAGSVIAAAIAMIVVNVIENGAVVGIVGLGIAGAIYGVLIGIVVAAVGANNPIATGAIAGVAWYAVIAAVLVFWIIPNPVLDVLQLLLAVLTAAGIGAAAGFGFRYMATRFR